MLAQADDLTATGLLLELATSTAAGLLMAMDAEPTVKLPGHAAPAAAAGILSNGPGDRRQQLLNRLPVPSRSLVAGYL